jgi:hypothetical protein
MQRIGRRIAGNDEIWVVAKPLQVAIPDIAINILLGTGGNAKESNVPYRCQNEPNDDHSSRKPRHSEKLSNG